MQIILRSELVRSKTTRYATVHLDKEKKRICVSTLIRAGFPKDSGGRVEAFVHKASAESGYAEGQALLVTDHPDFLTTEEMMNRGLF